MATVYEDGIKPVSQDGTKAIECYERALQVTLKPHEKAYLYISTSSDHLTYP